MNTNPFILPIASYVRNIDVVACYKRQAATYLNIMTGKDLAACTAFVSDTIKTNTGHLQNPNIKFLQRQENGDRESVDGTILDYIYTSIKNNDILAPTLTAYTDPLVKESLLVGVVEAGIKGRNVAKKAMFAAEANKDKELQDIKNTEQTNFKLSNNSLSGAHASPSTPLFNKTAHNSLTSNCRVTSGYGNANNEKLLAGNRHYWASDIVIDNIVSIVTNTDYTELQRVITKYEIKYPTPEETLECVTYSSNHYWRNPKEIGKITLLISKLSDIQRAAFVYTGDLYHLRKHNDTLLRKFISKLSLKVTTITTGSVANIKKYSDDYAVLAHQICANEMKGKGKKYAELTPDTLNTLSGTLDNINDTLVEYRDFIQIFFTSDNIPASVAYIPQSTRQLVVVSDTDSTIFTVQDWVMWSEGSLASGQLGNAVAAALVFIASQAIIHILAKLSVNLGVVRSRIFDTTMKNEYFFPVFAVTNVAKHYYASISCREGNIFEEMDIEIKGVHLKSSNAPKEITKRAKEIMEEVLEAVALGKKIKALQYINEVANAQRAIETSILAGDTKFYKIGDIKKPEAYKDSSKSQYVFDALWNSAFSDKYPITLALPYQTIKIPTTLTSATLTQHWLSTITDTTVKDAFLKWMSDTGKINIPTLHIPLEAVRAYGIPVELHAVIDSRRIITELTRIYMLLLSTLGVYCPDGVLLMDQYKP